MELSRKSLPEGRFVFAEEDDFDQIRTLWQKAFNDDIDYINEYLSEYFNKRRIILFKSGEKVLSMASLFFVEIAGEKTIYIFALATAEEYRGQRIAAAILEYVQLLYNCKLILQPEKNGVELFYKKIGFTELEADRLYEACEEYNITDLTLGKFDGFIRENINIDTHSIIYKNMEADDVEKILPYFSLRHNRACESSPLCDYLGRYLYMPAWCIYDSTCFIVYTDNGEVLGASLPYCRENELAKNFLIQQEYFNEVLHKKHIVLAADNEGLEVLKNSGVLDDYEIETNPVFRDYLYSGESLRTLKGKKLAKKRNLIHQFEKNYEGRWEYVTPGYKERYQVLDMLDKWYLKRNDKDNISLYGEQKGLYDILNNEIFYSLFRFGGIKIDGELKAFSIGAMNDADNMAIIDIEKADSDINGLYQLINREFLIHEFPDVEIVNREDDSGEENLRHAKMSYSPIDFAIKYDLTQKQNI